MPAGAPSTVFKDVLETQLFRPYTLDSVTQEYIQAFFENDFGKDFTVDDCLDMVEPLMSEANVDEKQIRATCASIVQSLKAILYPNSKEAPAPPPSSSSASASSSSASPSASATAALISPLPSSSSSAAGATNTTAPLPLPVQPASSSPSPSAASPTLAANPAAQSRAGAQSAEDEDEDDEADDATAPGNKGESDGSGSSSSNSDDNDDKDDDDDDEEQEGHYNEVTPPSKADAEHMEIESEPDHTEMAHAACMTRGRFPPGESYDVNLSNLVLAQGPRDLLVNATLKLLRDHRYGLIGRNGVGKSTLLKRIATHKIVGFPSYLRTFYVNGEAPPSKLTSLQYVVAADSERESLLNELDNTTVTSQRLVEIHARLEEIDADTAEDRARDILVGLGFDAKKLATTTDLLSGGWRMRVALACALFLHPDILMLDEPEAHLDSAGQVWLQEFLNNYSGTVLLVSHSPAFLTAVTTDIIHFHHRRLDHYACDYTGYLKAKEDKQKKQVHLQTELDRRREHVRDSIRKIVAKAANNPRDQKRLQQAASRKKKLNRMGFEKTEDGRKWNMQSHGIRQGAINSNTGGFKNGKMTAVSTVLTDEPSIRFHFDAAESLGAEVPIIQLEGVGFGYGSSSSTSSLAPSSGAKLLFSGITLNVLPSARIAMLGLNGQGKSTLLKLMAGAITPTQGTVRRHRQARVVYFTQHHVDQFDLTKSPVKHLFYLWLAARAKEANGPAASAPPSALELQMLYESQEQPIRKHLGAFGITSGLAYQRIATLSGGQRTRLALASLTFLAPPHVLLLDEVTNCLDMDSIESLQAALKEFQGAVVLVSHVSSFVDTVCNRIYALERGKLKLIEGQTASEYMASIEEI